MKKLNEEFIKKVINKGDYIGTGRFHLSRCYDTGDGTVLLELPITRALNIFTKQSRLFTRYL